MVVAEPIIRYGDGKNCKNGSIPTLIDSQCLYISYIYFDTIYLVLISGFMLSDEEAYIQGAPQLLANNTAADSSWSKMSGKSIFDTIELGFGKRTICFVGLIQAEK